MSNRQGGPAGDNAGQGARDLGGSRTSINGIAVGVPWTRGLIGVSVQEASTHGPANGGGVAQVGGAAAICRRDRPRRPRPRLRAIRVAGRPGPTRSGAWAPSIHRRDRGGSICGFGAPLPNSEVRESATFGVLVLTLYESRYEWEIVPVEGGPFTDRGEGVCHP